MKVSAISYEQPAFKGFERVSVKTCDVKRGFVNKILNLYGKVCYRGQAVNIANKFQDSLQDSIIEDSKVSGFSPQWYVENIKRNGAKVPKNFMSGNEDVIIATGIADMKKLESFLTRSVVQRKAEGAAAFLKSVFSPQYRKIPQASRRYCAMCGVLDKYNGRLNRFLSDNQVQDITLDQIIRQTRRIVMSRVPRVH